MKLVIVGDTLLDRDIDGVVRRLYSDAPAPVLEEQSATDRPGGAGLSALLAARDGHDVALVTALSDDAGSARLSELLTAAGVEVYALPLPAPTPEKVRLLTGGRVLARVDRGGAPVPPGEPAFALDDLLGGAAAILVSDYGRGVARQARLRAALDGAKAPIVWDPHPGGPPPVPGVRLASPNLSEALRFTDDRANGSELAAAERAGHTLQQRWRAGAVAVTLGAHGAVLCQAGPTPMVIPAPAATGNDPCGAGDRFAVSATVALAEGALVSEAVETGVASASRFVAAGGLLTPPVAAPKSDDVGALVAAVRARGGTVVATGGCFDLLHSGHIATLEAARSLGDCLIVCLNSDVSVTRLKGPERPYNRENDRERVLRAMECVDAVVVFDEPTPAAVLTWLRPDLWVKGGDYADELPESEIVHRWGGRCVVVPYVPGHSTTELVAAGRRSEVPA
jgi:D-beta-D-heptose 7-phosphate kinase / D-beta-D-heptose 1-phosphate adenosyltransferase